MERIPPPAPVRPSDGLPRAGNDLTTGVPQVYWACRARCHPLRKPLVSTGGLGRRLPTSLVASRRRSTASCTCLWIEPVDNWRLRSEPRRHGCCARPRRVSEHAPGSLNRSRCGTEPISVRNTTDLGEGGRRRGGAPMWCVKRRWVAVLLAVDRRGCRFGSWRAGSGRGGGPGRLRLGCGVFPGHVCAGSRRG